MPVRRWAWNERYATRHSSSTVSLWYWQWRWNDFEKRWLGEFNAATIKSTASATAGLAGPFGKRHACVWPLNLQLLCLGVRTAIGGNQWRHSKAVLSSPSLQGKQWRQNEFETGGGAHVCRKATGKCLLSHPSTFLDLRVQLVVLVSAFVMVSTLWSVSCLLFFCSRYPRAVWSRRHLWQMR